MPELWLKFTDEDGTEHRVKAEGGVFTVGRHSANDLSISDSRLSREHIRIELIDSAYLVSDRGSSNGTTLNGKRLTEPETLRDGDKLDLGGGVAIAVEIEAAADDPALSTGVSAPEYGEFSPIENPNLPPPATSANAVVSESGGIPFGYFLIAPLMGLLVLLFVGGLLVYTNSGGTQPAATNPNDSYSSSDEEDEPVNDRESTPTPIKTSASPTGSTNNDDQPEIVSNNSSSQPPVNSTESKIEQNGTMFLRRIADDPRAFLTGEQARRVAPKLEQLVRSPALLDNINYARKSSAEIKALATAKNLKPQFLAVAAIAKLGSTRGDVLETAKSMVDIYAKLRAANPDELASEALLMVAAYEQGAAGKTTQMRDLVEKLSKKEDASSRTIKSIWYLEDSGNLSTQDFDRALTFLAVGTITQNPKDFGVNLDALLL